MRFKLTIEYTGTRYSGWQIQNNARTVQGEIDKAVREVTGARDVELYGSGRTDAGVHALAQVAHLDLALPPPLLRQGRRAPERLRQLLNEALPSDISVLRLEPVPRRFHARHDAVARSYLYQISRRQTAFAKPFVWWVKEPLSFAPMREAAARFVGFHDFQSFSDDDPSATSTTVALELLDLHEDDDLIVVHIEGSHFLWKMVRRIVGGLVEVGRGALSVDEAAAFLTTRSPIPARLTAPAAGLFLERVYYPGDPRDVPFRASIRIPAAP